MPSRAAGSPPGQARAVRLFWGAASLTVAVLLLGILLAPGSPTNSRGDYWMYVGSRWTPAVKGLYLYRVHSASGKPEAAGLASGWLWQSNIDALRGSPSRIFAQLRAEWPDVRKMLRGPRNPAFMVVHPNGRYLYTADSAVAGTVSAFQVDGVIGKLTMLNVKSSGGSLPAFATFDKT